MFLQGFDCIVGTGGLEPATLWKQRSNGFLIYPDEESQDFNCGISASSRKTPCCASNPASSCMVLWAEYFRILRRGIRTIRQGLMYGLSSLKLSHSNRLALFLLTASRSNFLPHTTPHCNCSNGATAATTAGPACLTPR